MKAILEQVKELKGLVYVFLEEEIHLEKFTYEKLIAFFEDLADENELENFIQFLVDAIGEEAMDNLLQKLESMTDTIKFCTNEDEEEDNEPTKSNNKTLDPVKFVNMNNYFSYDPELIVEGIDSVSVSVGKYLAYINAGMSSDQAFALLTVDGERQHELATMDKQIQLKQLEIEAQVRMSSVKQLLSR